MITYNVYNKEAKVVGEEQLSEKIFGLKPNEALVHQAAVAQMSNERKVLAHTKDRSEVRGGGKKPWRQKGTGRARAGSSRSPIWIGGGVTFGPTKDRNFSKKINLKMRRKALCVVLSDKISDKSLAIVDELALTEYKTKEFKKIVDTLATKILNEKGRRSILVIDQAPAMTTKASVRNLVDTEMITVDNLNILDLLKYKNVILTQSALKVIAERYK